MEILEASDLRFIEDAVKLLERPSFLVKVSGYLGRPIVYVAEKLPQRAQALIQRGVDKALTSGLRLAVQSMSHEDAVELPSSTAAAKKWAHTFTAMGFGAASGFAGGWALALELPLTTTLIMRSIASMAQASGFDPRDPKTALEILTVFAYGSPGSKMDNDSDASFYIQRAALDVLIRDGAAFIAGKSATQVMKAIESGGAPKLIELLAKVAVRLNVIAGEKFLAQSLPLLGAAGGAVINGMFNDYYSNIAYYAFGLKRLEARYGQAVVRSAYELAAKRLPPA
jgi:hypothetical protein